MAKYEPLIHYLQSAPDDSVRLALSDIERIIGDRLPASARSYAAWWANSATADTHTWAHAWQAAGWKAKVTIANGIVEFTRSTAAQSALDALRPTAKPTVMDLVAQAGIDVTAWGFADGQPYPAPASNPNFCYDWSFGSPSEGYVACVWHSSLSERNGRIVYDCDIGSYGRSLQKELARGGLTNVQRGRLVKWVRRAAAFEAAVTASFHSVRPLRLILNIGDIRDADDSADSQAFVWQRRLDAEPWYVHTLSSGDGLIVRGEPPYKIEERSTMMDPLPETPGEDDKFREGQIRVRQGQGEFRSKLLEAYGRRCTVTGTLLEPLLEAAHIVPHAEETNYRVTNGLLLRADIHTLYDLYHLSIDERGVIHVSREAKRTDYAQWHGKRIRFPDRSSMAPSPSNLAGRHQRFLQRERERVL
jgi:hypothetical protein